MISPCCLSVYPFVCPSVCVSPQFLLRVLLYNIIIFLSVCGSPSNSFVLYAVRVVSKESRRLVLPRTSCYIFNKVPWTWDLHLLLKPFNRKGL
jgi:hypothetical protein